MKLALSRVTVRQDTKEYFVKLRSTSANGNFKPALI